MVKAGFHMDRSWCHVQGLLARPIPAVNDAKERAGTTYPATNRLVAQLVELGILSEMTGNKRNRRFRYAPYIALFQDSPFEEREA